MLRSAVREGFTPVSPLPEGTSYHLLLSFLSASLDDGTISMEFMRLHTCACFQVSVRVLFIPPPRPTSPPTLAGGGGGGRCLVVAMAMNP